MSVKILCDKAGCGIEINQNEGGGTFTLMTIISHLDPATKQAVPQLKQEEFQLCDKHAKEFLTFIKKENQENKVEGKQEN